MEKQKASQFLERLDVILSFVILIFVVRTILLYDLFVISFFTWSKIETSPLKSIQIYANFEYNHHR